MCWHIAISFIFYDHHAYYSDRHYWNYGADLNMEVRRLKRLHSPNLGSKENSRHEREQLMYHMYIWRIAKSSVPKEARLGYPKKMLFAGPADTHNYFDNLPFVFPV